MLDPNAASTLSLDDIRSMCDELIAAHGDRMPEGIRA
jgi:alpha-galactosidase